MGELRFDGKSVVVTGAGRGLGRCHALLLASRGAAVVVADNGVSLEGADPSPGPAEEVAEEIRGLGGHAVACVASVADEDGAASIVQAAIDAFGGIDVLVNNAGIVDPHWFEKLTFEQFRRMVDVHLLGTVLMCQTAWPHLIKAKSARIVNTISEAMLGNTPKACSYGAGKGGIFGFTRTLALDAARFGVGVNSVAPRGKTRAQDIRKLAEVFEMPEETFQGDFFETMKPELVSPAVAYLAHESCPLTGEVLVSGAGQVMRLVVSETAGIVKENLSIEDVAENIDTILDPAGSQIMTVGVPVT